MTKPIENTVNATFNLSNLTGMMSKTAVFATASITCILIEIAIKLRTLEVTAENAVETLASEEWANVNRTFNTGRMKAFGKKLLTKAMAKHIATIQWDIDKKGGAFMEIGGVYRVTDQSDSKGPKYSARYTNGYNSTFTVIRDWIKSDAESALEALDPANVNVGAYQMYRDSYQKAKAEERKAETDSNQTENNPDTDAPDLTEESSEGLRDTYAKADSVKRNAFAASEHMTDGAWQEVHKELDALCKLFQDIIRANPEPETEEIAPEPEAEAEVKKVA